MYWEPVCNRKHWTFWKLISQLQPIEMKADRNVPVHVSIMKMMMLLNHNFQEEVAHRCTILLCYLGCDDQYRNPNINDRDHLVGQITKWEVAKKKYVDDWWWFDRPGVQYAGQCHHQGRRSPHPGLEVCFLWMIMVITIMNMAKMTMIT